MALLLIYLGILGAFLVCYSFGLHSCPSRRISYFWLGNFPDGGSLQFGFETTNQILEIIFFLKIQMVVLMIHIRNYKG